MDVKQLPQNALHSSLDNRESDSNIINASEGHPEKHHYREIQMKKEGEAVSSNSHEILSI
jgi:hypothetical protein